MSRGETETETRTLATGKITWEIRDGRPGRLRIKDLRAMSAGRTDDDDVEGQDRTTQRRRGDAFRLVWTPMTDATWAKGVRGRA